MKTLTRFLLTLVTLFVFVTGASLSAQLSGGRIAAGTVILDGANPTSVTTNLNEITSCSVTLIASGWTPGTGSEPVTLTVVPHAVRGRLDIYAWDNETDPPAASTSVAFRVSYLCIGEI